MHLQYCLQHGGHFVQASIWIIPYPTYLFLTLQVASLTAPQIQKDPKPVHLLVAVTGDVKVTRCHRTLQSQQTSQRVSVRKM